MLKQRGCRYIPHVLAMETNQEIWVQNDDRLPTRSSDGSDQQRIESIATPGTPPRSFKYDKPEIIRSNANFTLDAGIFVVLKLALFGER